MEVNSSPGAPAPSAHEPAVRMGGESSAPQPSQPNGLPEPEGMEGQNPADANPAEPAEIEQTPEQESFSKRFTQLARREKQLIERERQTKEIHQKAEPLLKAIEAKNPMAALEAMGMSYQDVTNWVLNDGQKPEPSVNDEIADLKKQLAEERQARVDRDKKKETEYIENTINDHKAKIKSAIETAGDDYELVVSHEAYDTVFEVIEEHYNQTLQETGEGELLTVQDAAAMVEKHLEEQAQRFLKAKKFQPKPAEPTGEQSAQMPSGDQYQAGGYTTLSNDMVNTAPAPKQDQYLSDEESKARLAQRLVFS